MLFENINRLCREKGITIQSLEKSCGIANGTIGKWRIHNHSPRISTLKKVADFFQVTVDDLLRDPERKE